MTKNSHAEGRSNFCVKLKLLFDHFQYFHNTKTRACNLRGNQEAPRIFEQNWKLPLMKIGLSPIATVHQLKWNECLPGCQWKNLQSCGFVCGVSVASSFLCLSFHSFLKSSRLRCFLRQFSSRSRRSRHAEQVLVLAQGSDVFPSSAEQSNPSDPAHLTALWSHVEVPPQVRHSWAFAVLHSLSRSMNTDWFPPGVKRTQCICIDFNYPTITWKSHKVRKHFCKYLRFHVSKRLHLWSWESVCLRWHCPAFIISGSISATCWPSEKLLQEISRCPSQQSRERLEARTWMWAESPTNQTAWLKKSEEMSVWKSSWRFSPADRPTSLLNEQLLVWRDTSEFFPVALKLPVLPGFWARCVCSFRGSAGLQSNLSRIKKASFFILTI